MSDLNQILIDKVEMSMKASKQAMAQLEYLKMKVEVLIKSRDELMERILELQGTVRNTSKYTHNMQRYQARGENAIKIESNIPIPKNNAGRKRGPKGLGLYDEMKLGQSVVFPDIKALNIFMSCVRARYGRKKTVSRKQQDGSYRVWKVA